MVYQRIFNSLCLSPVDSGHHCETMPERTNVAPCPDPPQTRKELEEQLQSLLIAAYSNDVRVTGGVDVSTGSAAWGIEISELELKTDT